MATSGMEFPAPLTEPLGFLLERDRRQSGESSEILEFSQVKPTATGETWAPQQLCKKKRPERAGERVHGQERHRVTAVSEFGQDRLAVAIKSPD